MNKKPIILGIESSCDETAASIITENEQGMPTILSSIVSSQVDVHKEFGGVVPELAARSHMEKIDLITKKALDESGVKMEDLDAIAATAGPGLIVCLSVGLSFGKAMASSLNKPFIAVNHLEGHALSPKLNSELNYPYLLLLISGGHTQFLSVKGLGNYKRLGTTIDDAVGEAFDKTAKLLGIEFPGGPQIEVYAKKGDPNKYELPKPIFHKGGCNLSFAGLKTAVLKISKQIKTDQEKYDLAASFQKTIEEILYKKSKIAFEEFKKMNTTNKNKFVVAGGVAANKRIREVLTNLCKEEDFEAIFPPINLCGDNAAMIAMVGLEKFKLKHQFPNFKFSKFASKTKEEASKNWMFNQNAFFKKDSFNLVKTHNCLYPYKENSFTSKNETIGAIYIVRDPRNVISSMCNHYSMNFNEMYNKMIDENSSLLEKSHDNDYSNFTYLNSWSNHYKSWKNSSGFKTLFIKYEDLEMK